MCAGASFHYQMPSNYGDVHVGVYNGENYNRVEVNDQKSFQIRGTVRPFARGKMVLRGIRASAFYDGDNYVKLDAISDVDNPRINRLELRSESGGAVGANPADPPIAAGVTTVWLRLTKSGENYSGAYSLDGTTWTAFASPVTNAMAAPSFGVMSFHASCGVSEILMFQLGASCAGCSCCPGKCVFL